MLPQTVPGRLLPPGTGLTVIAVRIYGETAAGQKLPPDPGHINEIPKWSVPNPEQLFLARFEGRTGFARMPEVDKSQVVNQITAAQDICAD